MNVLIIEDELLAAEKLERLLKKYDPTIEITEHFDSIVESATWLGNPSNKVDLIFLDIQLTDGLSFEIFNRVQVNTPIIFTTAYNEYALKAFKLNSIDYLLKPITFDDLYSSMKKFENFPKALNQQTYPQNFEQLSKILSTVNTNYKSRFMVKVGERLHSYSHDKIDLFFAEGRTVYLLQNQGKRYIIDYKMEELQELLDPSLFFRISRSFIININAIQGVSIHSNSRLKIFMSQNFDRELIVSRDRVASFKDWFNGQPIGG